MSPLHVVDKTTEFKFGESPSCLKFTMLPYNKMLTESGVQQILWSVWCFCFIPTFALPFIPPFPFVLNMGTSHDLYLDLYFVLPAHAILQGLHPVLWIPLPHLCRYFSKGTFLVLISLLCAVSPVKCCHFTVWTFCCRFKQNTSVLVRVQAGNRWHTRRVNWRDLMNKLFAEVWVGLKEPKTCGNISSDEQYQETLPPQFPRMSREESGSQSRENRSCGRTPCETLCSRVGESLC